jgi:hypothetical protein
MHDKEEIQKMVLTVELVKDTVLGGAIVQAMRENEPEELQRMFDYFMQREWFVKRLHLMMDTYMSPEVQAAKKALDFAERLGHE